MVSFVASLLLFTFFLSGIEGPSTFLSIYLQAFWFLFLFFILFFTINLYLYCDLIFTSPSI